MNWPSSNWMPSPDYKWLKCLHCNVVVGYIIFLDSFTRGFGKKRSFLKIRQMWALIGHASPPSSSPCLSVLSVKSWMQWVLSTDPFQEGGLQHPTHTHTHWYHSAFTDTPCFFGLQHLENLKKMVKGTDALWLTVPWWWILCPFSWCRMGSGILLGSWLIPCARWGGLQPSDCPRPFRWSCCTLKQVWSFSEEEAMGCKLLVERDGCLDTGLSRKKHLEENPYVWVYLRLWKAGEKFRVTESGRAAANMIEKQASKK